jgi:hypothetical protein
MIDPFAAAPAEPVADEAQVQEGVITPTKTPSLFNEDGSRKTNITVTPEGKLEIVTTLKGGNSYDEPWVVIHAGSVEESDALLDQKFADYLAKVKRVAAHFNGGGVAKPAAAPAAQSVSAPPAGATAPPSGETRSCKHGAMAYKSGVAKASGKPWQAFMCPTPKGAPDQCEAQWIR